MKNKNDGSMLNMNQNQDQRNPSFRHTWLDIAWVFTCLVLLGTFALEFRKDNLCSQMGVDFRGYYASAQIAREQGFAAVYNQELQRSYQSSLYYRCPTPTDQHPLYVAMPYLPPYVLLFIPFSLVDFTAGYILWVGLQLVFFLAYLYRFTRALGVRVNSARILQWGISIPLLINLYVGQINALLVILLGEFALALSRDRRRWSGLWLSAMLVKPHTLILLVPGLLLNQSWGVLAGFALGSAAIISLAFAMVGYQGMASLAQLTFQFAGPLIQAPQGMVNLRALALNLEMILLPWIAWSFAVVGMLFVVGLILNRWRNWSANAIIGWVALIALTVFGTLIVSWHTHFYMLMLLVPFLLYLDACGDLPFVMLAAWLLAPPMIYFLAHLLNPDLERSIFGMGMLALILYMSSGLTRRFLNH